MAFSLTNSSPRHGTEADYEDQGVFDLHDDFDLDDGLSDEALYSDTDDASEAEMAGKEEQYTEIKEQMYQDKLAQLKRHLQQLKEGTYPEYMKKMKKIDQNHKERLRVNEIWYEYERTQIEEDTVKEIKAAGKEYEQKKVELKESLIAELEEKKRLIQSERNSVDLTGGSGIVAFQIHTAEKDQSDAYFFDAMELKPASTRKLRRRANDPVPIPEKRRKPSPDILSLINFCVPEEDILHDLATLHKYSGKSAAPMKKLSAPAVSHHLPAATVVPGNQENLYEARIDDGRLYYEKKWFHRGQPVYVDSKDMGKCGAVISAVGTQEVWLRKTNDNSKLKVFVTQLQKGKYVIRKRTS